MATGEAMSRQTSIDSGVERRLEVRNDMSTRVLGPIVVWLLLQVCAGAAPPPRRDVDLTAPDGTKLKATYYAAATAGPGVLLMHQCNQQRKTWDGVARELATKGIHVVTFDFRGFGESAGTRSNDIPQPERQRQVTEKWPGDVDAAYRFLTSQPQVNGKQIGAGGASCGVNQSIL